MLAHYLQTDDEAEIFRGLRKMVHQLVCEMSGQQRESRAPRPAAV